MPRGENLHCMFRTSYVRYTTRPPANCRAARQAWDYHFKEGPIVWMQLVDGYWGVERPDGHIDEVENAGWD